jgi:hypothetical protein
LTIRRKIAMIGNATWAAPSIGGFSATLILGVACASSHAILMLAGD